MVDTEEFGLCVGHQFSRKLQSETVQSQPEQASPLVATHALGAAKRVVPVSTPDNRPLFDA